MTTKVGARELQSKLSRYLDLAGEGEQITVTERGRAIAIIVPIAEDAECSLRPRLTPPVSGVMISLYGS